MLKNTIAIGALLAASAFAGVCTDFVVVNITTNDTTVAQNLLKLTHRKI